MSSTSGSAFMPTRSGFCSCAAPGAAASDKAPSAIAAPTPRAANLPNKAVSFARRLCAASPLA